MEGSLGASLQTSQDFPRAAKFSTPLCCPGIPALFPEEKLSVLAAPHVGSSLSRKTHLRPSSGRQTPLHFLAARSSKPVDASYLPPRSVSGERCEDAPCPHSSALLLVLGSLSLLRVSLLWPRPALAHQRWCWLAWGASAQLLGLTRSVVGSRLLPGPKAEFFSFVWLCQPSKKLIPRNPD